MESMEMEAPAGLGADSTNDTHVKRIPWLLCGERAVKRGRETNQGSGSQRGGNFVPHPAFGMSGHISGCRHWGGGFLARSCQTSNSEQDAPPPRTMTKKDPAQSTNSAATRSSEAAPEWWHGDQSGGEKDPLGCIQKAELMRCLTSSGSNKTAGKGDTAARPGASIAPQVSSTRSSLPGRTTLLSLPPPQVHTAPLSCRLETHHGQQSRNKSGSCNPGSRPSLVTLLFTYLEEPKFAV